jgi:hypothetical protein
MMVSNDRFQRWQKIAIDQLGYALNLLLTFSVAALAYCFTLMKDKDFAPSTNASYALVIALITLGISALTGILCVLNRLWDFRLTARRARNDPQAPTREEMNVISATTWFLFHALTVTFGLGILSLGVVIVITYGSKLP